MTALVAKFLLYKWIICLFFLKISDEWLDQGIWAAHLVSQLWFFTLSAPATLPAEVLTVPNVPCEYSKQHYQPNPHSDKSNQVFANCFPGQAQQAPKQATPTIELFPSSTTTP